MTRDMSKEVVFVTGASSGFGAAIAKRFARAGAKLVLAARRADRLAKLAKTLDVPAHIIALDVRDNKAVEEAVATLPRPFRKLSVLVNNAGLAQGLEPAQRSLLSDWETMVDTNIKGLMYVTRAVLPGMVERDRGHVINIGSVAAVYPYTGGNAYGGTKAFVAQYSLNLRADLLGTKIRVTLIEPGLAETEFSLVRFHGDRERADKVYQGVDPLTASDIAESAYWAVSLPAHVNINRIEMMPVQQAANGIGISRRTE